jgi:hypothetical protein
MAMPAAVPARPALALPPPYSLVSLRESGDAFAHASAIAERAGAGTLVWVRRFDLIEFAVVLEPEEPLRTARRAFFCGMNAVADAVAAYCPPEVELVIDWPDGFRLNGGRIGGGRLGWPNGCPEDEPPPWLVFSAMLTAAWVGADDPGSRPSATSLEEEGFSGTDGPAVVEAFAQYLMLGFDLLAERGFEPIADSYLRRLAIRKAGEERRIADGGDLLIRDPGASAAERLALLPALERAAWFDPATGRPKV